MKPLPRLRISRIKSVQVLNELRKDEGLRLKAYQDTKGIWTIGFGTNLQTLEITQELADKLLKEKYRQAVLQAESVLEYHQLSATRKAVIQSMIYQMGFDGVLKFKKMWAAIVDRDWDKAANEMLDSKWARSDSPSRAKRMAVRFRKNDWDIA